MVESTYVSKWDVAIAALLNEVHEKREIGLGVRHFQHLAQKYSIRFDDIMATICLLAAHGEWRYEASPNDDPIVSQQWLEKIVADGRIKEEDALKFAGAWWPVN